MKTKKPTTEQVIFETIVFGTLKALQNHMLKEGVITEAEAENTQLTEHLESVLNELAVHLIPQMVPHMPGALNYLTGGDSTQVAQPDLSGLSADELETIKTDYGLHPNTEKDQFGNFTSVEPEKQEMTGKVLDFFKRAGGIARNRF